MAMTIFAKGGFAELAMPMSLEDDSSMVTEYSGERRAVQSRK